MRDDEDDRQPIPDGAARPGRLGQLRAIQMRRMLLPRGPRGETSPRAVVVRLALALVLAVSLWVRVSADTDPVRTFAYTDVPIKVATAAHYSLLTSLPPGEIHGEALQSALRDASPPRLYVDLTHATSTAPLTVPVRVRDIPRGAQYTYSPHMVAVRLQTESTRAGLPVQAQGYGPPPPGFNPPDFAVSPPTVTISGPSQEVARVSTVRLTDLNAGDYTQDTTLMATPQLFDSAGRSLGRAVVRVTPPRVTVTVRVRRQPFQQLVPVSPIITGSVAPGYEISGITVYPQFVQAVSSSPLTTATLTTEPVSIEGWTATGVREVRLVGPSGVTLYRNRAIVTVDVAPLPGSATTMAGVTVVGKRPGTTVTLDTPAVTVVYGGPLPRLRAAATTPPRAVLDVGGRVPGVYHLTPRIILPGGLRVLALTPSALRVTITAPAQPRRRPSATPSAPTPGPSP